MEYSIKDTKEVLIQKLDEVQHLAEAVEAKDEEISRLSKELNALKIDKDGEKAKEIKALKDSLNDEIKMLRDQIKENGDVEGLREAYTELVEENKKLVNYINTSRRINVNFLKGQQAALDNAIEMDSILFDTINKK